MRWYTSVVPVTLKTEAGGSLEPRSYGRQSNTLSLKDKHCATKWWFLCRFTGQSGPWGMGHSSLAGTRQRAPPPWYLPTDFGVPQAWLSLTQSQLSPPGGREETVRPVRDFRPSPRKPGAAPRGGCQASVLLGPLPKGSSTSLPDWPAALTSADSLLQPTS